jgi:hypothetical protein
MSSNGVVETLSATPWCNSRGKQQLLQHRRIRGGLRVVMVVEEDVRILGFFAQVNDNRHPFFDLLFA